MDAERSAALDELADALSAYPQYGRAVQYMRSLTGAAPYPRVDAYPITFLREAGAPRPSLVMSNLPTRLKGLMRMSFMSGFTASVRWKGSFERNVTSIWLAGGKESGCQEPGSQKLACQQTGCQRPGSQFALSFQQLAASLYNVFRSYRCSFPRVSSDFWQGSTPKSWRAAIMSLAWRGSRALHMPGRRSGRPSWSSLTPLPLSMLRGS